jgi:hypothetical protein
MMRCTWKIGIKYPKVNIKIISSVADELKHYLSNGQADIAFVLDFNKPSGICEVNFM